MEFHFSQRESSQTRPIGEQSDGQTLRMARGFLKESRSRGSFRNRLRSSDSHPSNGASRLGRALQELDIWVLRYDDSAEANNAKAKIKVDCAW